MVADLVPGAGLDDAAGLHDGDGVGEVSDEGHGVGDEQAGEVVAGLEVAEEVDDLGGDGDVECGDGLVEDEEGGAEGEGAGDVDALALAAGELVGIAGEGGGVRGGLRRGVGGGGW